MTMTLTYSIQVHNSGYFTAQDDKPLFFKFFCLRFGQRDEDFTECFVCCRFEQRDDCTSVWIPEVNACCSVRVLFLIDGSGY